MQERRRFIRIPESLPIAYEILSGAKTESFLTKDIGEGGIRFYVHRFIPKYSLLKVRLSLKKMYFSFDAVVRIVWIKEEPRSERYEVGAEFVNIPQEATAHLIDYIKSLIK